MTVGDIVALVLVGIAMVCAVVFSVRRRKKRGGGCGCGCGNCHGCLPGESRKKKENKK